MRYYFDVELNFDQLLIYGSRIQIHIYILKQSFQTKKLQFLSHVHVPKLLCLKANYFTNLISKLLCSNHLSKMPLCSLTRELWLYEPNHHDLLINVYIFKIQLYVYIISSPEKVFLQYPVSKSHYLIVLSLEAEIKDSPDGKN